MDSESFSLAWPRDGRAIVDRRPANRVFKTYLRRVFFSSMVSNNS